MISLSNQFAPASVPYRHKVSAVARVAPVNLNLDVPVNPYLHSETRARAEQSAKFTQRGHYSAQAAGPGFAAHILVEAGLTGPDPFASRRGAQAYAGKEIKAGCVRLVA